MGYCALNGARTSAAGGRKAAHLVRRMENGARTWGRVRHRGTAGDMGGAVGSGVCGYDNGTVRDVGGKEGHWGM